MSLPRVFNFSGGKTSAYMVIHYYQQGDIVLFTDTGREHPETYKFIDTFEANEGIPVFKTKLFDTPDAFRSLLESMDFKVLPNRNKRICTDKLKLKAAKDFLRKEFCLRKYQSFLGLRADEELRVRKRRWQEKEGSWIKSAMPLYDNGVNKAMVNAYWQNKSYTLNIPPILGNCTACFQKGKNSIIKIFALYPELALPWIEDEELAKKHNFTSNSKRAIKNSGRRYFSDCSMRDLLEASQNQLTLFSKESMILDLEQAIPASNCICTF